MKLFFRTIGEGTPLIILHGLWGASENWLPIAHLLEDKFQVILPDVRNHGQSPHDEAMNYEVMSNDIIELIEDLKLPVRPHIAGHSMGGKIVMALLLKRPELVNKANGMVEVITGLSISWRISIFPVYITGKKSRKPFNNISERNVLNNCF